MKDFIVKLMAGKIKVLHEGELRGKGRKGRSISIDLVVDSSI